MICTGYGEDIRTITDGELDHAIEYTRQNLLKLSDYAPASCRNQFVANHNALLAERASLRRKTFPLRETT